MKKLVWFFAIVLVVGTLVAQDKPTASDAKSKKILKAAKTKIESHKTIKIKFSFTEVDKNNKESKPKNGRVYVKKDKYQLKFAGQVVYCDGKTKWTHLVSAKEVHITNASSEDDFANPTSILKNYSKNYKTRFIRTEKLDGKKVDIVDLYPKKGKKAYHRVRLYIQSTSKQIAKTKVYYKNGSSQTIKITEYIVDKPIADSYFKWDSAKHPDVEEVDLRD